MKQAATHSRANREERMLPPGGTSAIGSETFILPCRWFALFTLPMISFSFSRSLFYGFPLKFLYSNLPLFSFTSILRLSVEPHQSVIFVLGAKVIPGFDGKARSRLLFSAKSPALRVVFPPKNLAFPNPYLFKHPKRKRPMRQKDA